MTEIATVALTLLAVAVFWVACGYLLGRTTTSTPGPRPGRAHPHCAARGCCYVRRGNARVCGTCGHTVEVGS